MTGERSRLPVLSRRIALAALAISVVEITMLLAREAAMRDTYGRLFEAEGAHENAEGIDWEALRARNPDIIAWLKVERTAIDYPVVQKAGGEGAYYLDHNVFGAPDAAGAPYLDRRCTPDGTHLLVFGHHVIGDETAMFSPIHRAYEQTRFNSVGAATWSTPARENLMLRPLCGLRVDKSFKGIQRFSFEGGDFISWLKRLMSQASARSSTADVTKMTRCLTLVTCSSPLLGQRERTLLLFGA